MLAQEHFTPTHALGIAGDSSTLYIGLIALSANVAVTLVGTALARARGWRPSYAGLADADYEAPA